jgi:hypothetical protein
MLQAATSSTIEAPTVEAPVPTLIAAAQGEATTTELDGEEQVEVIVTRDNGDLPPDCGPRAVAAILLRFVDSWNYGDQAELAQLIAARSGIRGEGFQWYSVTEGDPRNGGRYFVTYRPEGVLEYAAERHVHGERLRIMAVDVGGGAISASASADRRTTRSLGLNLCTGQGRRRLRHRPHQGLEHGPRPKQQLASFTPRAVPRTRHEGGRRRGRGLYAHVRRVQVIGPDESLHLVSD